MKNGKIYKRNEINMKLAYESKEGYYLDNNTHTLYIAGSRDINDVLDWMKIRLGTVENSNIYKHIEPVFKENKDSDYVVGHSAGGSAALQLKKKAPTTHNNDHL